MTKINKPPYTYTLTLTGDGIEKVIAPLSKAQTKHWEKAGLQALFTQTFTLDDEAHEEMENSATYLPDWRAMENAVHIEGIEAHHGYLDVTTEDGFKVWSIGLEDKKFWGKFIDDYKEVDDEAPEEGVAGTFVGTTTYTGNMSFEIVTKKKFNPSLIYVFITNINGVQCVTSVYYEDVLLEGELGGRYNEQQAKLVVPDKSGEPRVDTYSVRPWDD